MQNLFMVGAISVYMHHNNIIMIQLQQRWSVCRLGLYIYLVSFLDQVYFLRSYPFSYTYMYQRILKIKRG